MNIPNLLTAARIFLIPVFILLFLAPGPQRSVWAAVIFIIASLTDLLDGYLARRWEQITRLGKFLDPIADKLLILSALILLVDFNRVSAWIAIVLIGREVAMTGLRAIASSEGVIISAEPMGKYKLAAQVFAVVLLILDYKAPYLDFRVWGTALLWISMVLAIISAVQYGMRYIMLSRVGGSR
jgi:CDP-diacylglycerol--glycerol-3-phosphate 3-phosphatidyltransferase